MIEWLYHVSLLNGEDHPECPDHHTCCQFEALWSHLLNCHYTEDVGNPNAPCSTFGCSVLKEIMYCFFSRREEVYPNNHPVLQTPSVCNSSSIKKCVCYYTLLSKLSGSPTFNARGQELVQERTPGTAPRPGVKINRQLDAKLLENYGNVWQAIVSERLKMYGAHQLHVPSHYIENIVHENLIHRQCMDRRISPSTLTFIRKRILKNQSPSSRKRAKDVFPAPGSSQIQPPENACSDQTF